MAESAAQVAPEFLWRKSSRSSANGNCVEVAGNRADLVAVRDSKDPAGPMLTLGPQDWRAFTAGIKAGEFDTV